MYFFKYIFGIFYVVIIVAVCNRINTSAASPPNTEVMVHQYEKEPVAALSRCKMKYALLKEVPVIVNTYRSANFLRPSRIPICGVKP